MFLSGILQGTCFNNLRSSRCAHRAELSASKFLIGDELRSWLRPDLVAVNSRSAKREILVQ
jgi:hypothetical protein